MAKNNKETEPTLKLDDKSYNINDLADDQKIMVSHIDSLNRKIDGARFNLQQLEVGRAAFISSLKSALEKSEEEK
tara:strand:+ start:1010 stop:1234 length:225 start_codon:yes stop_codon:yes gene_type:complete